MPDGGTAIVEPLGKVTVLLSMTPCGTNSKS